MSQGESLEELSCSLPINPSMERTKGMKCMHCAVENMIVVCTSSFSGAGAGQELCGGRMSDTT